MYNITPVKFSASSNFFDVADQLMKDVFNSSPFVTSKVDANFIKGSTYPKMDIYETEKEVVIECSVPGMEKEEIKVTVQHDLFELPKDSVLLTISGDTKSKDERKSFRYEYYLKELKKSSFDRSILINGCKFDDPSNAKVELKDGILSITFSKKEVEEKSKEVVLKIK